MNNLIHEEKTQIMIATADILIEMIQKRMNNRIKALNELETSPLDNLPDQVKQMREIEASKIRMVVQEQMDLVEIMRSLFPKVEALKQKHLIGKKSNVKEG